MKLLIEVDVELKDPTWTHQDLLDNSVYFFAGAIDRAEARSILSPEAPPFTVDTSDITIWDEEGYAEDHQVTKARVLTTEEGVTFTPWSNGYAVGFHVTAEGKPDRWVMFNPSSSTSTENIDDSDVFVYHSEHDDPDDSPVCYINIWNLRCKHCDEAAEDTGDGFHFIHKDSRSKYCQPNGPSDEAMRGPEDVTS